VSISGTDFKVFNASGEFYNKHQEFQIRMKKGLKKIALD
jgi:hypothetical protein